MKDNMMTLTNTAAQNNRTGNTAAIIDSGLPSWIEQTTPARRTRRTGTTRTRGRALRPPRNGANAPTTPGGRGPRVHNGSYARSHGDNARTLRATIPAVHRAHEGAAPAQHTIGRPVRSSGTNRRTIGAILGLGLFLGGALNYAWADPQPLESPAATYSVGAASSSVGE
ncbi:hypothetical protein KRX51_05085 [Corynebacterium sp. TAE3-ERU12]|uniref:hypothetical protein n=1 Tax=Corynebacterium sp. TAE3-ERU12 TaxID=2849491 RepID=UPI001C463C89|nr:hypothetical protein [Corynebacterium sp. TAE3-ERU12]MBV7295294.1 hypothetical protein [Corynebacterium sp. TAE3-ERU12]